MNVWEAVVRSHTSYPPLPPATRVRPPGPNDTPPTDRALVFCRSRTAKPPVNGTHWPQAQGNSAMTFSHLTPARCHWLSILASALDPRSAPRLVRLLLGAILARGRRTVTSWIRAAGLSGEFRACYTTVSAAGKRADRIAARLAHGVLKPLLPGMGRLVFALDDTPTERYGPHVQGAGVHHNPNPGPAGAPFVYGHVWVSLALLGRHPERGTVALPVQARIYIRRADLEALPVQRRRPFHTKLDLAAQQLRWLTPWVRRDYAERWAVVDGGYAKRPFVAPAVAAGWVVVGRLRKDAALFSVPGPKPPGRRGPAPT